jgi:hypothetical protein
MVGQEQYLHVEIYPHGGWWKDSNGRTGQVPPAQSNRGPLATVAALTNSFGLDGWRLVDVISGQHNSYRLSFEAVFDDGDGADTDADHPAERRRASISAG